MKFHRHRHRFVHAITLATLAVLLFTLAAMPAHAQAAAAPTNLTAELTDTEGEVRLTWGAAEGSVSYRACQRVQSPAGAWSCVDRTATNALFIGLAVGKVHDFVVLSFDGSAYSAWVWTNLMVEAITPHVCPITGLAIPEGYLSVGEKNTDSFGDEFTLTSITRKPTIRILGTNSVPFGGRAFIKVCGKVKAHSSGSTRFTTGLKNNLATDKGIGFMWIDEATTEWYEVGKIPAGRTRSACDIWGIADDATTVIYTINNFRNNPGVYRVDLPAK